MGHSGRRGTISRRCYPPGSTIKRLIAHGGAGAAMRATNPRNRLAIRFERKFEIEAVAWNLSLPRHPRRRKAAARQAAAADTFVVAPDCSTGLPNHALSWLNARLYTKAGSQGALVTLPPADAHRRTKPGPVVISLSCLAVTASLDCRYSFGDTPSSDDGLELTIEAPESNHHEARSILLDLFLTPNRVRRQPRCKSPIKREAGSLARVKSCHSLLFFRASNYNAPTANPAVGCPRPAYWSARRKVVPA